MRRLPFRRSANKTAPSEPSPSNVPSPSNATSPHSVDEPVTQTSPMVDEHVTQTSPLVSPHSGSTPQASPPLMSQIPVKQSSDPQGSAQTPTIPTTIPSSDRRLLLVKVTAKTWQPSKGAVAILKQVVFSHFDGPYIRWSKTPLKKLDQWWKMFKNKCRWDESQFPELFVRKTFNHVGGNILRPLMSRAHTEGKRPMWMKEEIWEACLEEWKKEDSLQHSETNKANRAIAAEKGSPIYRGGSVSTTAHKKCLFDGTGKELTPKELFETLYMKPDGTCGDVGRQTLDRFESLMETASQEVDPAQGSHSVDQKRLWIEAAGGVKRGRIVGMGSEVESMLEMTHYVHDTTPMNSLACVPDTFQEDVLAKMANLESQLSQELTNITEKVTNMGEKVTTMDDKVVTLEQHMERSVENVRIETRLNIEGIQKNMQCWEKKLDMFVDKIGALLVDKASSK